MSNASDLLASSSSSEAPLNDQNPWPGLESYDESSKAYFHGRGAEAAELLRMVRRAPLTLLYGKSGLGKSSLLKAGLFPLLRRERFLPIYVRLTLSGVSTEPVLNQVLPLLQGELVFAEVEFPTVHEGETVWEYLHRRDLEFWSTDNFRLTPVFVFDQFEELFARRGCSSNHAEQVLDDLGDLIENRIPEKLADEKAAHKWASLDLMSHGYRTVISFREDFLPEMKDWEGRVPSLLRNCLRLEAMSGAKATEAVERAGVAVLEPGVAAYIVDFVGRQDRVADGAKAGKLVIEPVLLSLCCSELNRRRTLEQRIDRDLVDAIGQDILETFYQSALDDPQVKGSPDVALFIEGELIQGDRFRGDYPVDEALRNSLLTEGQLKVLTDQHRLLRVVQHPDTARVELIHDRLVPVVSKARNERRNVRERQRRKWRLVGIGLLVGIIVLFWGAVTSIRFTMAKSRALAWEALLGVDQDPARSAHLALAVVRQEPSSEIGVAALRQSLVMLETAHTERILQIGEPIADARYSSDGALLLIASGKNLAVYDSKTYSPLRVPIQRKEAILRAWLIEKNRTLVTQTEDGQAQVQRLDDTSVRLMTCEGEQNRVYTIEVSPDDKHVAIGCYNGEVLVWDISDSSSKPYAYTHKVTESVTVTAMAFSHDGRYLASGDAIGTVNIWKLGHPGVWIARGNPNEKDSPITHEKYYSIRDIEFHREDAGLLVTAGDDSQAIVWHLDLERRQLAKAEPNRWSLKHKHPVIAAKFAPNSGDSRPLVTVSGKVTQLWLDATMNAKQRRAHDDWVNDANASTDGEWLVTASNDNTARIWSTRSGTSIAVLRGHQDAVTHAVFSPDGKQVVTAGADGMVRIWHFRAPSLLDSSERWALNARFDPRGARVAVGEEQGRAFIFELTDAGTEKVASSRDLYGVDRDQLWSLSWSRDGKYLLGVGSDASIAPRTKPILWDVTLNRTITPEWLTSMLTAAFSSGSDELVTVSRSGQLSIWETKSLSVDGPLQPRLASDEESGRWLAAISPDGKWIAALNGNIVELFQRANLGVRVRELQGHNGQIKSLQFSSDSEWLLTASADKTARIWPMERTGPPKVLGGGHSAALAAASFSRDGKWVVTGSVDNTLSVWDARTTKQLAVLRRHSEGVNSVEFSPDGKWILSASDDGTVFMGQCEACTMTVEELKRLAPVLAKLSEEELNEIQTKTATPFFKLPRF